MSWLNQQCSLVMIFEGNAQSTEQEEYCRYACEYESDDDDDDDAADDEEEDDADDDYDHDDDDDDDDDE
eukprot:5842331-Amphidinium_carterae.1